MNHRYTPCWIAAASLLLLAAEPSGSAPPEAPRSVSLFETSAVRAAIDDAPIRLEPNAGPDGGPAVVFDDPVASEASFEIDLSDRNIDFAAYDELHFDLLLEEGIVEPAVTLWGYPNERRTRRWFFKRFPQIGQWERVRYELNLDDDSSLKTANEPRQALHIRLSRPVAQPAEHAGVARARIANVQLVRNPVQVTLDPRAVMVEHTDESLRYVHPLRVTNRQAQALTVEVAIEPETLAHFEASAGSHHVDVEPGETVEVPLVLAIPADRLAELPAGHTERARVRVTVPALENVVAEPIRGYRPVYLFAAVPPDASAAVRVVDQPDTVSPDRLAALEQAMDWRFEAPSDVTPRYEDHFRCPACRFRLRAREIDQYYCHNRDCERHEQTTNVDHDDPLFASYLSIYHKDNAALAADLMRAWRATGEARFAEKARDILTAYATHYADLPMVGPHSTGMHCRLSSATLFIKESLLPFCDAYLLLVESGMAEDDELARIREQLLVPVMHNLNLHFYGTSAGQVNFILATVKAAIATGRWWYFADALAGDAGVDVVLRRTFDADGIGVEGGAYARSAAERIVNLAAMLDRLDIAIDRDRLEQIERNSRAIGILADHEGTSITLPNTGFTQLIQGSQATWRKASINWGRNRERGEADLLSYRFADGQGDLIEPTGRIAYGHPGSRFMLRTLAHNVLVLDGRDINLDRQTQAFFHDGASWSGVLITDRAEAPAYASARLARALVLVRGALVVVDTVNADTPVTVDQPVYGLPALVTNLPGTARPVRLADEPGLANWRGRDEPVDALAVRFAASPDEPPALAVHYLGSPATVLTGEAIAGWTGEARDLLVLRAAQVTQWQGAFVYSSLREGPVVEQIAPLAGELGDGAAAVQIRFDDGQRAHVLISFDGAARALDGQSVDQHRRIDVRLQRDASQED